MPCYATDTNEPIPHFEKCCNDNALLVSVMSEAYRLPEPLYRQAIEQTMELIERELLPDGGFYSALDDSEGVEGKFYVWNKTEVDALLQEDAPVFTAFSTLAQPVTGNIRIYYR